MSKNVAVLEGTSGKQFNGVKKIQLNNIEGGSSYWVPEDETKLGTKYINENGTYVASEEVDDEEINRGWYGYDKVVVSGVGGGTYTAQDDDHLNGQDLTPDDDYWISKDEESGDPIVVPLPSILGFSAYPAKLVYEDGEHIQLTGAIVRAAMASAGDWEDEEHPHGIIPHTELKVEPTTADISKVSDQKTISDFCPEGINVAGSHLEGYNEGNLKNWFVFEGDYVVATLDSNGTLNGGLLLCSSDPNSVGKAGFNQWEKPSTLNTYALNRSYTYDNKTVYYYEYRSGYKPDVWTGSVNTGLPYDPTVIAWTAVYGESVGGTQEITVKWNRPKDGKELTTSFDVRVVPSNNTDDDTEG